ncbi:hypothetical protein ABT160_23950 [Streptomyces sp. NPDC001941]|uniref:hypothetical protein n=1 Tax=Streptomyces sp. NPDC001941 TaxID=3154659 RepID=UPI0033180315
MPRLIPLPVLDWIKSPCGAGADERAVARGLTPRERLDATRPGPVRPDLAAAADAAAYGDWEPAARLLRATAKTGDREGQYAYTSTLARLAAEDDGWLLAWEAARPASPQAAAVRALGTVGRARRARGADRALVERARAEVARAAELDPADPTPLVGEVALALEAEYPHEEARALFARITEHAPHHYAAHRAALRYWGARGRGSADLSARFAAEAAAGAPPGGLLHALPLVSRYEHEASGPTARALVDALAADVAAADPEHPWLAEVRLLLAWSLVEQGRYAEAVEQFRATDGYAGAFPWTGRPDPALALSRARDKALRRA